jgi:hypothetical protein
VVTTLVRLVEVKKCFSMRLVSEAYWYDDLFSALSGLAAGIQIAAIMDILASMLGIIVLSVLVLAAICLPLKPRGRVLGVQILSWIAALLQSLTFAAASTDLCQKDRMDFESSTLDCSKEKIIAGTGAIFSVCMLYVVSALLVLYFFYYYVLLYQEEKISKNDALNQTVLLITDPF